jgi:hypothetical protein
MNEEMLLRDTCNIQDRIQSFILSKKEDDFIYLLNTLHNYKVKREQIYDEHQTTFPKLDQLYMRDRVFTHINFPSINSIIK